MLSKKTSINAVEKSMKNEQFWIETKLDGERLVLHKKGSEYKWFSRNSTDYTHLYGGGIAEASGDNGNSFISYIKGQFKPGIDSCILDGEMLVFNTETLSQEVYPIIF